LQTLSIIIPCYNEEDGIPNLVAQLNPVREKLQANYQVDMIFVNDGSRDRTVELLRAAYSDDSRVQIVSHEKNQGLGAAIRTGFEHAQGDFVITMDSDCTYPPDQIPLMLKVLESGADMVTASPYHPQGRVVGVPEYRLFLSKSLSVVYRLLLHVNLYTFTALFRTYPKRVVKEIPFESNALGI
jgi:dolichol-phosphate mannosyltransferase